MKTALLLAALPLGLGPCTNQEIHIRGYQEFCWEIADIKGSLSGNGTITMDGLTIRRRNETDVRCADFSIDSVKFTCGIDYDGDGKIDAEVGPQIDRKNSITPPITVGGTSGYSPDPGKSIKGQTKVHVTYEVTVNNDPTPSASNSGYATYK